MEGCGQHPDGGDAVVDGGELLWCVAPAALAAGATAVSTYLTLYKLGYIGTLQCAVGSCETVNTSRWATFLGMPVAAWFRGPLQGMLRQYLLDDVAKRRDLFRPAFIASMIDEHVSGRCDWSSRLWALLFLELWFREFID